MALSSSGPPWASRIVTPILAAAVAIGLMVGVSACAFPTVANPTVVPPVALLPHVVQHTVQVLLPNKQTTKGTATCGPGEVLLSGGYDTTKQLPLGGDQVIEVLDSYPSDATGTPPSGQGQTETSWTVTAYSYIPQPVSIPVTVNCLLGSQALSGVWFHGIALQSTGPVVATQGCTDPVLKTLTGGGFHLAAPYSVMMASYPTAPNGMSHKAWAVEILHAPQVTAEPANGTVYAMCASQLYDAPLAEAQLMTSPSAVDWALQQVSVGCPSQGELLVGGGYQHSPYLGLWADDLAAPQLNAWAVATWVGTKDAPQQPITTWAICVATTPGVVPTAPPQPTLVPVPTHFVPIVGFHVSPISFQQACTSPSDPLPALRVTLDNGGSNVAIDYQVAIVGKSPNGREPWASATPASGTVGAAQQAPLTLTPAGDVCSQLWMAGTTQPVSFTASVQLTAGGSGATMITDIVSPYKLT
jgi:hypothetical protein